MLVKPLKKNTLFATYIHVGVLIQCSPQGWVITDGLQCRLLVHKNGVEERLIWVIEPPLNQSEWSMLVWEDSYIAVLDSYNEVMVAADYSAKGWHCGEARKDCILSI